VKEQKKGRPGNCTEIPGGNKERGSHHVDSTKEQMFTGTKNEQKWSAALTVSMSDKIFCFFVTGLEVKPMRKNFEKKKKCCSA
jgi:hypothetical protein